MEIAVLLQDGTPTPRDDQFQLSSLVFDIEGRLISFILKYGSDRYSYYDTNEFSKKHVEYVPPGGWGEKGATADITKPGYYKDIEFDSYRHDELTIDQIKKKRYKKFHSTPSNGNWFVECTILSPGFNGGTNDDYHDFMRLAKYTFKVTSGNWSSYTTSKDFPPLSEGLNPQPSDPDYSVVEVIFNDFSNTALGDFYKLNYGDHVYGWNIPDKLETKEDLNYKYTHGELGKPNRFDLGIDMSTICCYIELIRAEILEKIAINPIYEIINKATEYYLGQQGLQHNAIFAQNYEQFPLVDRAIGGLLKDWGYLKYEGDLNIKISPVFQTSVPNKVAIRTYLNGLENFYYKFSIGDEDDFFDNILGSDRLQELMKILPSSSVSVIPIEVRKDWLEEFVFNGDMSEEEQRTVVNIMLSFLGTSQADEIMDYFLSKPNGYVKTRFEYLYNNLDDARLERYPIINYFVDGETNRMHFVYAMVNLWGISKYNMLHVPNGTPPGEEVDHGINTNSFWHSPTGESYFPQYNNSGEKISGAEYSIEFNGSTHVNFDTSELEFSVEHYENKHVVKKSMYGKHVYIERFENDFKFSIDLDDFGGEYKNVRRKTKSKYHMYQPISLVGYTADLELYVPNAIPIPAFLFFYAEDFKRIKKIDNAIIFVAEVVQEVVLFFTTGGIANLRHLRHIKHVSKLWKVKTTYETMTAAQKAEKLLIWRGLEGAAEVTSASASLMDSFFTYIANNNQDPRDAELDTALANFFMVLSLASDGGSRAARYKCAKAARTLKNRMDYLTNYENGHNIPQKVVTMVLEVDASGELAKSDFYNFIVGIPDSTMDSGSNYLGAFWASLSSDEVRTRFWTSFAHRASPTNENVEFWVDMNKTVNGIQAAKCQAWKNTLPKFSAVSSNKEFLDAIIRLKHVDLLPVQIILAFTNKAMSGTSQVRPRGGNKFDLNLNGTTSHVTVDNGFEILDPIYNHSIDTNLFTSQKMNDYLNSPNGYFGVQYLKVDQPGGHVLHKNLLVKTTTSLTPTEGQFVLNGQIYERISGNHYQLNPAWTEDEILHEMAYAFSKKKAVNAVSQGSKHGENSYWVEITYKSKLMDGTKVTFKHTNYYRYGLQPVIYQHIHLIELKF